MNNEHPSGALANHNLISCIDNLSLQDFDDLTDCTRLATTSADLAHNRFASTDLWMEEYAVTLGFLGWTLHENAIRTRKRTNINGSIAEHLVRSAEISRDPQQGNAMIDTLDALRSDKPALFSLDNESVMGRRFQVAPVRYDAKGDLHMALFNLELVANVTKSSFLFWSWQEQSATLLQRSAFFKLDRQRLHSQRPLIEKRLRDITTQRFALRKKRS